MRVSLVAKYALRTLGRNARRTVLSVVGVGFGCAIALFLTSFMRGAMEIRVRSIAESGFGHLRFVPTGWSRSRDSRLRLPDWQTAMQRARAAPGVKLAIPHARSTGLLAFGTKVAGVELLGVDPEVEGMGNRLIRGLSEGRYLEPEDRGMTVIGQAIAERLDVELEDDLLLTVSRKGGEMSYAMLRIVGIISTGSRDLDAGLCHVHLQDVERFTGYPGVAEITLHIHDPSRVDGFVRELRPLLTDGQEVLTWKEVLPAQGGDSESDKAFMNLLIGIVAVVVTLGITSAQLTAILQRKREFAVLMALGMRGRQVIRLVLLEAAALGILGAAAGLLVATPAVYYTATTGIDFSGMMGGEVSISGVLFDPIFYSHMGFWLVPHALGVALASTLIAALYPAWYAVKTDPTSALSLREA